MLLKVGLEKLKLDMGRAIRSRQRVWVEEGRPEIEPGMKYGRFATRRAFSLIELLAVIGVIGALVAILIPSLRKSLQHASATMCMHQLHEIDQALNAYRLDHRGWLPVPEDREFGRPIDPHGVSWFGRLVPKYIGTTSALVCPADPARNVIDVGVELERHPEPANASSYGLNDVIRAAGLWELDRSEPARPAETLMLADMGPDHARAMGYTVGALGRNNGRLPWDDLFHPAVAGLRHSWMTGRHFGHINTLSIGGVVKRLRTGDLMIEPIKSYYGDCASGGCPLCRTYQVAHYNFAPARLYWWTGEIPHND